MTKKKKWGKGKEERKKKKKKKNRRKVVQRMDKGRATKSNRMFLPKSYANRNDFFDTS